MLSKRCPLVAVRDFCYRFPLHNLFAARMVDFLSWALRYSVHLSDKYV
jgi:hypothetical protein